uniref:Uncharacterized protein n=1 Tax=Anguilla anguilla TaxID=7936 RepID=A0A0E9VEZ8_ANGAN
MHCFWCIPQSSKKCGQCQLGSD